MSPKVPAQNDHNMFWGKQKKKTRNNTKRDSFTMKSSYIQEHYIALKKGES